MNLYAVANNINFMNLLCKKTDENVRFKKYKSHQVNFDVRVALNSSTALFFANNAK